MILSIWVFFIVGDPLASDHGIPYVQQTVPASVHASHDASYLVEETCRSKFERLYPGHHVCDSGWCQQEVRVMGDG